MNDIERALEDIRYELVTLHGLMATDGAKPTKPWGIDTRAALAQLDYLAATFAHVQPIVEAARAWVAGVYLGQGKRLAAHEDAVAAYETWLSSRHAEELWRKIEPRLEPRQPAAQN